MQYLCGFDTLIRNLYVICIEKEISSNYGRNKSHKSYTRREKEVK